MDPIELDDRVFIEIRNMAALERAFRDYIGLGPHLSRIRVESTLASLRSEKLQRNQLRSINLDTEEITLTAQYLAHLNTVLPRPNRAYLATFNIRQGELRLLKTFDNTILRLVRLQIAKLSHVPVV